MSSEDSNRNDCVLFCDLSDYISHLALTEKSKMIDEGIPSRLLDELTSPKRERPYPVEDQENKNIDSAYKTFPENTTMEFSFATTDFKESLNICDLDTGSTSLLDCPNKDHADYGTCLTHADSLKMVDVDQYISEPLLDELTCLSWNSQGRKMSPDADELIKELDNMDSAFKNLTNATIFFRGNSNVSHESTGTTVPSDDTTTTDVRVQTYRWPLFIERNSNNLTLESNNNNNKSNYS